MRKLTLLTGLAFALSSGLAFGAYSAATEAEDRLEFSRADEDHDGYITTTEVEDELTRTVFDEVDENDDGRLDKEEHALARDYLSNLSPG